MDIWGVGTAVIAVTTGAISLAIGYMWGALDEPKRSGWDAPRVMEPVEQPTVEKTLAERQFDEIIGDPWRNTP